MTIRKRINQLTDAQFLHNDIAISAIINLCEKILIGLVRVI